MKKGGEDKKAMVALLVFIVNTKGPFGGNVFKVGLDIHI